MSGCDELEDRIRVVNQLLPTTVTSRQLDSLLSDINRDVVANEADIQAAIKRCLTAELEIELAKGDINKLVDRLSNIRTTVDHITTIEVPKQLAELQTAKKNLTTTISTLEKLQLLVRIVLDIKSKNCVVDGDIVGLFTAGCQLATIFSAHQLCLLQHAVCASQTTTAPATSTTTTTTASSSSRGTRSLIELLEEFDRLKLQYQRVTMEMARAGDFSLTSYRLAVALGCHVEYERQYTSRHQYRQPINDLSDLKAAFIWYEQMVGYAVKHDQHNDVATQSLTTNSTSTTITTSVTATVILPQVFKVTFIEQFKPRIAELCQQYASDYYYYYYCSSGSSSSSSSKATNSSKQLSLVQVAAIMKMTVSFEKRHDMLLSSSFKLLTPCFLAAEQQGLDTWLDKVEFTTVNVGIYVSASDLFQYYRLSIKQIRHLMPVMPVLELMSMFSNYTSFYLDRLMLASGLRSTSKQQSPSTSPLSPTSLLPTVKTTAWLSKLSRVADTSLLSSSSTPEIKGRSATSSAVTVVTLDRLFVVINTLDFVNKNIQSLADTYKVELTEIDERCHDCISTAITTAINLVMSQKLQTSITTTIDRVLLSSATEVVNTTTVDDVTTEITAVLTEVLTAAKSQLINQSLLSHFNNKLVSNFNLYYVDIVKARRCKKRRDTDNDRQQQQITQLLTDLRTIRLAITNSLAANVKDDNTAELYLKSWLADILTDDISKEMETGIGTRGQTVRATITGGGRLSRHAFKRSIGTIGDMFGK